MPLLQVRPSALLSAGHFFVLSFFLSPRCCGDKTASPNQPVSGNEGWARWGGYPDITYPLVLSNGQDPPRCSRRPWALLSGGMGIKFFPLANHAPTLHTRYTSVDTRMFAPPYQHSATPDPTERRTHKERHQAVSSDSYSFHSF